MPLVAAGIGALGSVAGGLIQSQGQKDANKTNIQLAREQNEWNLAQWHRENAYNDPSSQIQRLKAAGLNVASMYANPSAGMVSAASSKPAAAARVENEATGRAEGLTRAFESLMTGIMQNQQVNKIQAQTELMKTQADLAEVRQQEIYTNMGKMAAQIRNLDSGTNLNTRKTLEVSARINNLDADTLFKQEKTRGQNIYNRYAPSLHTSSIELRRSAEKLNSQQRWAVAEKIAQGWRQLSIQSGRLSIDQTLLPSRISLIKQQIDNLAAGKSGIDITNKLREAGLPYAEVNAISNAVENVFKSVLPGADVATELLK